MKEIRKKSHENIINSPLCRPFFKACGGGGCLGRANSIYVHKENKKKKSHRNINTSLCLSFLKACGGSGCLSGAARVRGLARIFAIAVGWLRWGCAGAWPDPGPASRGGGDPGVGPGGGARSSLYLCLIV